MKSFRDFLVWDNNKDVEPFVTAVTRLQKFYFDRGLVIFKVSISVPRLAWKMLFDSSKRSRTHFQIFGTEDEDLYRTFKKNIIGGPSIIFKRYHKVNETLIRGKRLYKSIVGYDANALYLMSLSSSMPTGAYVRRLATNNFRPERQTRHVSMYQWLDWKSCVDGVDIIHKLNAGHEKRIGPYLVDEYCCQTNTVYEVSLSNVIRNDFLMFNSKKKIKKN